MRARSDKSRAVIVSFSIAPEDDPPGMLGWLGRERRLTDALIAATCDRAMMITLRRVRR